MHESVGNVPKPHNRTSSAGLGTPPGSRVPSDIAVPCAEDPESGITQASPQVSESHLSGPLSVVALKRELLSL